MAGRHMDLMWLVLLIGTYMIVMHTASALSNGTLSELRGEPVLVHSSIFWECD